MAMDPGVQQLFDLTGKIFLVAGGARNLGRDMATALAEAGGHGIITSRGESPAQAAAHEIGKATGATLEGLSMDATSEKEVARVFSRIAERYGKLDILVNCVGGGSGTGSPSFENRSLAEWESMHQTNLMSIFLLCRYGLSLMRKQGYGSIINIASIAGIVGRDRRIYPPEMPPQSVDYASAKSAVIGMTRDLAAYAGPYGIRVNAISPGGFERGQPKAFIEAYADRTPLRRMGRDGVDLKGAVLFLAGEASAYVTGHNLVVDGGFTICR
jgi:NAD(P)-dependent dehydrogenase (short-subunit alcohol dehydrogenase family)